MQRTTSAEKTAASATQYPSFNQNSVLGSWFIHTVSASRNLSSGHVHVLNYHSTHLSLQVPGSESHTCQTYSHPWVKNISHNHARHKYLYGSINQYIPVLQRLNYINCKHIYNRMQAPAARVGTYHAGPVPPTASRNGRALDFNTRFSAGDDPHERAHTQRCPSRS